MKRFASIALSVLATANILAAQDNRTYFNQGPSTEQKAADYVNKGNADLKDEKYAEALVAFQTALKLNPTASAYEGIGESYQMLKQFDKAFSAYQQTLRLAPTNPYYHVDLGFLYLDMTRYENALTELREALRLKPEFALASFGLGTAYYELERFPEAAEAFKEANRLQPTNANSLRKLGDCYLEMGRKDEAAQVLQSLQKLDANRAKSFEGFFHQLFDVDSPEDLLLLGEAALADDHPSYAMRFYRRAMSLDKSPKTLVAAFRGMGQAYRAWKKPDKAISSFQKALQIKPDDAETNLYLGDTYVDLGKRPEALQIYKVLQRLDPDSAKKLNEEMNKPVKKSSP